jgi:hypothetical protein
MLSRVLDVNARLLAKEVDECDESLASLAKHTKFAE